MPRPRDGGKYSFPLYDQAEKICRKLGGEVCVAAMLGINKATVYRWQMAAPVGSDGLIPGRHIEFLKKQARYHGILLTDEDWIPKLRVAEQRFGMMSMHRKNLTDAEEAERREKSRQRAKIYRARKMLLEFALVQKQKRRNTPRRIIL